MSDNQRAPFQHCDVTSDTMLQRIVSWSPPLAKFLTSQTLADYFKPAIEWRPDDRFPLKEKMRTLIVEQAAKFNGPLVAKELDDQLKRHFIGETGTHLSFPRELDFENGPSYDNTLVWQGVITSASLYRHAGMKYHLCLNSSRVPVDNTNGARYLQLMPDASLLSVSSASKSTTIATFAEPLNEGKISEIGQAARERLFQLRQDEARKLVESCVYSAPSGRMMGWRDFLSKPRTVGDKTLATLELIEDDLRAAGMHPRTYAAETTRIEKALDLLRAPLLDKTAPFGFADQVAAVQAYLLNDALPNDTRLIVVDQAVCSRAFMVQALRDPATLTHRIFADDMLREKFVRDLGDIRAGWAGGETPDSPFNLIRTTKGVTKFQKVPHAEMADRYVPIRLADDIEQHRIIPTSALEVMLCTVESGLLMHGGMFQGIYNTDIQNKFSSFLDDIGEPNRAAALRSLPMDIITQSPCFGMNEQKKIMTFSDLMARPLTNLEMNRIPNIRAIDALTLAAPSLHDFFVYYEPKLSAGCEELVSPESRAKLYEQMSDTSVIARTPLPAAPAPKKELSLKKDFA